MLFSSSAAVYGLKYSGRALSSIIGGEDTNILDRHLFLTGTLSVEDNTNEIHLIDYNEETNSISPLAVFPHHGEVWKLAPCPGIPSTFIVVLKQGGSIAPSVAVYSYDYQEAISETLGTDAALDQQLVLPMNPEDDAVGPVNGASWSLGSQNPSSRVVATTHARGMKLWDVFQSSSINNLQFEHKADASCWDPHHAGMVSVATKSDVCCVDTRSMEVAYKLPEAHGEHMRVLDMDYNPNKPYYLVTGGDDGRAKFWDVRKGSEAVRIVKEHSHWITSIKYNRFHDQLVLSSSTDNLVKLWRMSSISSAPLLELDDDLSSAGGDDLVQNNLQKSPSKGSEDAIIKTFDDHDESVYSTAWSACDAWVFASMSFDGKVVVNHVPSAEKYKILL